MPEGRHYIIIDLKSFYASCECADRGLDPMTTDLVVADPERGRGTICLAVSPSLKAKGVRNRCRVYEIPKCFSYIMAEPRMQLYINYAAEIYGIYLRYFSADDIFVYSVDEAFIDVTGYLRTYHMTTREIAVFLIRTIEKELGLPATCGIGTNLYLAKIALDITAKHAADRIGELTEASFCETLWHHQPITDFWRIKQGTKRKLLRLGVCDMYGVAHTPLPVLQEAFGVDAVILYDHAWGREPTTIAEIKAYRPVSQSISVGQVLLKDYDYDGAMPVVKEMADQLAQELLRRHELTEVLHFYIGYSRHDGICPPPAAGTVRLPEWTHSRTFVTDALVQSYQKTVRHDTAIRHIYLNAERVRPDEAQELSLFGPSLDRERETRRQQTILDLQERFGKDAVFYARDLLDGATTLQRYHQIGGHKRGKDTDTQVQSRQDLPAIRCPGGAERRAQGKRA